MIIVCLLILLFLFLVITNTNEHFSIIKPYKKDFKYYGLKLEVEPSEFITLISDLKKDTNIPNQPKIEFIEKTTDLLDSDYIKTRKWIVDSISQIVLNSPKFRLLQNELNYEIIKEELRSYKTNEEQSVKKYIFVLTLHRKYADIGFIVYFDINYFVNQNKFSIDNFKLLGTPIEDEIKFGTLTNHSDNHIEKCSIEPNSYKCNTLMSYDNDYIEKNMEFLDNIKIEQARTKEEELYKCFYKEANNELECISKEYIKSKDSEDITMGSKGIWAKSKCTINEECPYYLANKNYSNNRGGCINGKCEMPLNVDLLTPLMPSPDMEPLCHNCNKDSCEGIDCFKCCKDQENPDLYPGLVSPDYAFDSDIEARLNETNKFENMGYSPFKFSF